MSNRICKDFELVQDNKFLKSELDIHPAREYFCERKEYLTLNFGVVFIVFVAFKLFYTKTMAKLDKKR
jgi:hypothetical protein